MLPFSTSLGDHRVFIAEIPTCSAFGLFRYKIVRIVPRRLVLSNKQSVKSYKNNVAEQFRIHWLLERLDTIDNLAVTGMNIQIHPSSL